MTFAYHSTCYQYLGPGYAHSDYRSFRTLKPVITKHLGYHVKNKNALNLQRWWWIYYHCGVGSGQSKHYFLQCT
jgi:hypothetical protein